MLLAMLFCTLAGTVVCFAFGGAVNAVVVPVAVALSVAVIVWFYGADRRVLVTAGITILVLSALTWLCALLSDHSYDGNAYHGEIIGRLLDGWNPLYEDAGSPVSWVCGYAKALEMMEALVAAVTGNMESGKVINFMLAGSAVLLVEGAVRIAFPILSVRKAWIVALLFGANPVLVTQLLTFYNDYALYCLLLIVASMMVLLYCVGWSWRWASVAFVATIIGMSTKFTHGFYLGIEWGAFLLLLCLARRSRTLVWRSAVLAVVGAAIGLGLIGYHPYVTNMQRYGHPLYPLMGDRVEDIMSENTPAEFQHSNRVVNFVKSMAMVKRVTYDQRYGGFGPLMLLLFILSVVLLALAWRRWQAIYVAVFIIAASFCFEQTWWARYIPFLWAIVPVGVLSSMLACDDRGIRIVRGCIYACVLLTMPLCAADALWLKIEASAYRRALYDGARRSGCVRVVIEPSDVHVRRRLDEAGIDYQIVTRENIDTTRALFLINDGFRGDVIELSPEAFGDLVAPGLRYRLLRMNERTLDFFDDIRPCD